MHLIRKIMVALVATLSVVTLSVPTSYSYDIVGTQGCVTRNVCVWEHEFFKGHRQIISGFSDYTDLNSHLHDQASSWANANVYTREYLGDWVHIGLIRMPVKLSYLEPGYSGTNLQDDIRPNGHDSNDKADFVARSDWRGWWF